ncbi:MAG: amphi-Trp domain-containing protein [Methylococcales bacterium]
MKQNKQSFQHESLQDSKSIEKILSAITTGLAKGKLKFSDEEDEIIFHPEGLMKLKVSAAQDDNQQRFNIKVSWQRDNDKKNKTLKVS